MARYERNIFSDGQELKSWLLNVHEKYYVELKKASAELPHSFWESYSSFSNTSGGIIILGVVEKTPQNEIIGVSNTEKLQRDLWNLVSNKSKVSYRNIENDDVAMYDFDGRQIVIVQIKEAPEREKPVFLNGKTEETYIRTGDGDRRATQEELRALLRNACHGQDSHPAERFTLNDLDEDSVSAYKLMVSKRFPQKSYSKMSDEIFLTEIGACFYDRDTNELKVKRGTLLFLGKCNAIKELFPHYHVDYFNRKGENPRWVDRISDDELGNEEMNLFHFYLRVYEKLRSLSMDEFSLDKQNRRAPVSDFDETLRECLVNTLAHADYDQGYPTIKIEVKNGCFSFINPGKMLVSPHQFVIGGDSRPRNEIVMKLFRFLGASERQGMGGPTIFKSASNQKYRRPEIETNIERTELKVWNIDLADSYPDLGEDEKDVLRVIVKSGKALSINEIKKQIGSTDYRLRKHLVPRLLANNLIQKMGVGRATKYCVSVTSAEIYTQVQMVLDSLKKMIKR